MSTTIKVESLKQKAEREIGDAAKGAKRNGGEPRKPRPVPTDWRAALALDRDNRPIPDDRNILLALRHAPDLVGLTQFNKFELCIELTRSPPWRTAAMGSAWTDDDDTALLVWLQQHSISLRSRSAIADAVALEAKDRAVHPVRAYLDALRWDGQARLGTWLADYLNVKSAGEYHKAIGRRFLVQAVARIMQPGVQADFTLVLEAPQGYGKSRTARTLARRPEWFTDSMPNLHDKDAAIQLGGRWVVELAELAAIRRTVDIESTKAFLTRPVDVYRPPYARRAIPVPRQCVFIATTNQREYLRDTTGNRRFWPVRCGVIDLAGLERDIDQLYAEAVGAYRTGESWHLTAKETELATIEQDERRLVTELEKEVLVYLDRLTTKETDVRSVLIAACQLDPTKSDYAERAGRLGPQVVEAMKRAGWYKAGITGRGDNRRNVYVYAGPMFENS